jgi:hypothetical protein
MEPHSEFTTDIQAVDAFFRNRNKATKLDRFKRYMETGMMSSATKTRRRQAFEFIDEVRKQISPCVAYLCCGGLATARLTALKSQIDQGIIKEVAKWAENCNLEGNLVTDAENFFRTLQPHRDLQAKRQGKQKGGTPIGHSVRDASESLSDYSSAYESAESDIVHLTTARDQVKFLEARLEKKLRATRAYRKLKTRRQKRSEVPIINIQSIIQYRYPSEQQASLGEGNVSVTTFVILLTYLSQAEIEDLMQSQPVLAKVNSSLTIEDLPPSWYKFYKQLREVRRAWADKFFQGKSRDHYSLKLDTDMT